MSSPPTPTSSAGAPPAHRDQPPAHPAVHLLHGLLMGSADIVPGVSGGTVALIVGIYERLISSIRAGASTIVAALRLDRARARERFAEVEWRLVLPLAVGILTALVVGAAVLPGLLEAYPVQMLAIFFGLIAGSLLVPWRRVDRHGPAEVAVTVGAALVAFVLVGLPPREVADPPLIQVFASASVAICAMILPGVSGSFLLLVLGMYLPTLEAVNDRNLAYIGTFTAGAVVGLGLFSKLLEYLLTRFHSLTMAALVGLMAGSLRALWPWQDDDRGLLAPSDGRSLGTALVLGLVAVAAVTALTRFGARGGREDLPLGD